MASEKESQAEVVVELTFGQPLQSQLTGDQVRRLLAQVGNQVVTWLRYDVQDVHDIPVVCVEGDISWRSDTAEFSSK